MKGTSQRRVVWVHDGDHLLNPFICQAAETLVDAGYSATVLDRLDRPGRTRYEHVGLGGLAHDDGNDVRVGCGQPYRRQTVGSSFPAGLRRCLLRAVSSAISTVIPPRSRSNLLDVWAQFRFLFSVLLHTLLRRPNIIIATMPSVATVGSIAAGLLRARLVYYPFELYGEQAFRVPERWKKLERHVLRTRIDSLITQNEERARIYVDERGARIAPTIVRNFKPFRGVAQSGDLRGLLGLAAQYRIVLYEGFLSGGRWLDKLILCAAYLPEDVRLVFIGRALRWWKEHAPSLLSASELSQKVLTLPWIPQEQLLEYVAAADVGIIIYDDQVRNNYYCAPGKLSDYVLAGVPVVAPDFPTIGPIIRDYGIGATFSGPEPGGIAVAINLVLSTPKEYWSTGLDRVRKDMVWETQVPIFLEAVAGQ